MLVQLLQLPAFLDGYQITSECKYLCEFYCKEALGLDPVQISGARFQYLPHEPEKGEDPHGLRGYA